MNFDIKDISVFKGALSVVKAVDGENTKRAKSQNHSDRVAGVSAVYVHKNNETANKNTSKQLKTFQPVDEWK